VASDISERNGYVMLACAASANVLFNRGCRRLFGIYSPADRYFIGLLDLMARQGFKTLSIIHEGNPFNRDVADGSELWARKFGLEVVFRRQFSEAPRSLTQAIDDLRSGHPSADGLIFSAYPPNCYRLLELLEEKNWRPPVIAQTIAPIHPDFSEKAGPAGDGVFSTSQWEPDERIPFPGTRQFIHDFTTETGLKPSYHAAAAYTACQILEKAVTTAGTIDHDKIRSVITSMDSVTVIGRFKVDHRGMQVGHNPFLIQWQDGEKKIVDPRKLQTASPRF
jgi:branched-chain amino acid transport system substrate-binding protein